MWFTQLFTAHESVHYYLITWGEVLFYNFPNQKFGIFQIFPNRKCFDFCIFPKQCLKINIKTHDSQQ